MTIQRLTGKTEKIGYPVGTMMFWHGYAAPPGWLVCDGSAVSISAYRQLYNVLTNGGTTFPYGANVGQTFLLPNLTDKFVARPDEFGFGALGANSSVGQTAGSKTHTHTWNLGLSIGASGSYTHQHTISGGNISGTAGAHNKTTLANTTAPSGLSVVTGSPGGTSYPSSNHIHNQTTQTNAFNHNATHSHAANSGTSNNTAHSHNYGISGNSYTPTAVSHIPPFINLGLPIILP